METSTGRGIVNLKRGQTLLDFVTLFLNERGISTFSLHERADGSWATSPMMFLNQEPKHVLTFTFKQFEQDDLGFHAKDLNAGELERDMKPLRKMLYG